MLCQSNTRMVDAVKAKYPGRFEVSFRPRDEHQAELAGHGIKSHGVVCLDKSGATLWKHGDHDLSQAELDKGVAVVLEKLGD